MKVLLIHQAFQTMTGAGGTRHFEFAKRWIGPENQFVVVASDVSYLDGKKIEAKAQQNEQGGIQVIHAKTPNYIHRGFFWRIVAFSLYMFSSFWSAIRVKNVDLVMGTSPSLFQAFSAAWVAIFKRKPFLLEVRDLWPDFAIEMGVLKSRVLIFLAKRVESFIYWRAKHILVNSPAYVDYLIGKGIKPEKISLIPNGVDPAMFEGDADPKRIRDEFNLGGKYVVTYTGAIGPANDIPTIVRGAERIKNRTDIHFLLVGGGKALEEIKALVAKKSLENVTIAGVRQKSEMADVLAASDACVATLQNIPMFKMTYPNKIFDYMAASKPIVLGIDGVIRKVVEDGQGGIFVEPGDDEKLAEAVVWMFENQTEANKMGVSGSHYVTTHFNREHHAKEFSDLIDKVLGYQNEKSKLN